LQHFSYTDNQQSGSKNSSLNFVHNVHHISSDARENSHVDSAQNNSHFYMTIPHVPNAVHNDSHVDATDVEKDNRPIQRQDVSDAARLLPGWLRWDPSVQQLLRRQNVSQSIPKLNSLDGAWTLTTGECVVFLWHIDAM